MKYKNALLRSALWLSLWITINLCHGQLYQTDYHIVHDHITLNDYNKSYLRHLEIAAYKYNDTLEMKAINISATFLVEVKETLTLTFTIFKLVADDYRQLPFSFTIDLCEYKKEGSMNPFGVKTAIEMSNFRGCPFAANKNYHVWNWIIEEEKSPPHLPPGQYSIKVFGAVIDGGYLCEITWFGQLVAAQKGAKKKPRRH